ncbi:adenine phosphoribosyltransferase-like [Lineus longissimus]|uniref:adenine phosphoribosyltransferase-like n=1 Tax=Lineus longissimus TaxID=88925 RepID=UPI002B4CC254
MAHNIERIRKIKDAITAYPDFPKPGVLFRNVFPVLRNPVLLEDLINLLAEQISNKAKKSGCSIDAIVGIDSRGFLFGPMISAKLGTAFVPIRKKGKLPGECIQLSYKLDYGEDTAEIEKDSITPGQNIVIIDDLLATGGTMKAACDLCQQVGGYIIECVVVVELDNLKGRDIIVPEVFSLISY